LLARTSYGVPLAAAVRHGNLHGVQFHPERSGAAGARLLRNFLEIG
jgi:glutamine amidotransferase